MLIEEIIIAQREREREMVLQLEEAMTYRVEITYRENSWHHLVDKWRGVTGHVAGDDGLQVLV